MRRERVSAGPRAFLGEEIKEMLGTRDVAGRCKARLGRAWRGRAGFGRVWPGRAIPTRTPAGNPGTNSMARLGEVGHRYG